MLTAGTMHNLNQPLGCHVLVCIKYPPSTRDRACPLNIGRFLGSTATFFLENP